MTDPSDQREPIEAAPPGDAGFTAGEPLARPSAAAAKPRRAKPEKRKRAPRRAGVTGWITRIVAFGSGLALVGLVIGGVTVYGLYQHYAENLPDVDGLIAYQPRVMSRVYADDGRLMTELATERRIFAPSSAIPDMVKQAFVSAEDQNFWTHHGVDPIAMARAGLTDLMHLGGGKRPIGASTITQQVAKNMLLDSSPTLSRKVKEAILATRIEATLPKERILELYLNEIYLGLQSYGVTAAAQAYFNKPLDEITLPEAAFLASLPKAPNNYNPFKFPDAARARRDWVLERMAEDKAITPEQAAAAKAQPIIPAKFHRPEPLTAGDWFTEEVRRRLIERFGADTTTTGGLMVRTSMDPSLQAMAEKTLRAGLLSYDRRFGGWRGPVGHEVGPEDLHTAWAASLAAMPKPAGMLAAWRLAMVIEVTDGEARVGWLEKDGSQHNGALMLSDLAWARPVHEGHVGGTPRRMGDVVHPGDVVMVEPPEAGAAPPVVPVAAAQAPGGRQRAAAVPPSERVQLRQVPKVQGALVSLDPATGRVLALVGGWSFEQSQFNRATQALRQPGSSFKPFVYLTALEQGVSPSQAFLNSPFEMTTPGGEVWHPGNYDGSSGGPVAMHVALQHSLNLVTIRVAQQATMDAVAATAIAFHVVDTMHKVLPESLGAVDTTVLRMASAYAGLAEGGREVIPSLIDSVQDQDGHVVYRAPGPVCDLCDAGAINPVLNDTRKQIADPQSVFQIVTMMRAVVEHGTGYEAGKGLGRQIAGKTGTSQDFKDAWFAGFTPDLVTVVWVGEDVPASLGNGETGGVIAAPIWHDFMQFALRDRPSLTFPVPPGVTLATWGGGNLDAFKTGQVPGASGPVAGAEVAESASHMDQGGAGAHGGVDSSLGGLY
jgi:penicillin-binding protein 1A